MYNGDKIGQWTVVDGTDFVRKNHKHIKVKCSCGNICNIRKYRLTTGKSLRCQSCASKSHDLPDEFTIRWIGNSIGEVTGTMFSHIRSKARERDMEFNISKEYLSDLFEKQSHKYALSGIPITLSKKIKSNNPDFSFITASVDRIDSNIGYVEGNIQWVHKDINRMKMNYNNEYFIQTCKLIAKNNE